MKQRVALFLGFCILLSGNLLPIRKDTKLLLEEIQKLSAQIKTLNEDVSLIRQTLRVMEDKVNALTRTGADDTQNKENVALSLQFLKEEINEMKNKVSEVIERLKSTTPVASGVVTPGEEVAVPEEIQSPENTYYTAYSDYMKKNYDLAIQGFQQFINLFPRNVLADNAMYWIGECYYAQKMFEQAVDTFSRLIESYADGDKTAAATLKKGYALIEMGRESEGISVLRQLITQFPLSEEASLAQQKIRDINQ
ncbi:MAG: tol-pal system protein YbgF [Candidatus Aminicenantes bacterium]|nr:tol-pal system protein YbgF [Candidatus Aminicenantes bacterium]